MQIEIAPDWQAQVIESIDAAQSVFEKCGVASPFLQFTFWKSLEESGVIGGDTDWQIKYVLISHHLQPVAWMPLFLKRQHRGEYVFDQGWAESYFRHGLDYYPRLVTAIPFTPVPDQRALVIDGYQYTAIWPLLCLAVKKLAEHYQASSWHLLFMDNALKEVMQSQQMAIRYNCQFLWNNAEYRQFDDFLARLTAKKRKSIKVEREKVKQQGIVCQCIEGKDISVAQWQFFYQCYVNTYIERGQKPYLNFKFFQMISKTMAENLMLVIASREHEMLASALFFKDDTHLYGRYWGAMEAIDCLHFEVCYYQGIEYAIHQQLKFFDPGTQGEHKLIRGFKPIYTYSAHWLSHAGFMQAVRDYCQEEFGHIQAYYQSAQESSPYKQMLD